MRGLHPESMADHPLTPLPPGEGSLDDRILDLLQGLQGRMAFNGLRRKLGAHPESLSRALRRLEREGLVEHADGGYRSLSSVDGHPAAWESELRPLARVVLPRELDESTVIARLSGRWFGSLRWVGVVDRPGHRLLAWAHRDGSGAVLLGVQRGVLRVYVPDPAASDDAADSEAMAYELLVQAVGQLQVGNGTSGTAYLLFGTRAGRAPFANN